MKKNILKISIMTVSLLFIMTALYLGLSLYYMDGFSYGTWVNGVYCTGKSAALINDELITHNTYDRIELKTLTGEKEVLLLKDIGYQVSFEKSLQKLKESQNPWLWFVNLSSSAKKQTLAPMGTFDEKEFEKAFHKLSVVKDREEKKQYAVAIRKTAEGYALLNEREAVLNIMKCEDTIKQAVLEGKTYISLKDADCYEALPLDTKMKATLGVWEKVKALQDCRIVYLFGETKEPVDASVVCDWICKTEDGDFLFDENGNLLWDKEKLYEYVEQLTDKYNTAGGERLFQTTRGDTVQIKGGTYGNLIDKKAEKEYLEQAFAEKKNELHEPVYLKKALVQGKDDIGNTYIEVDMGKQMMYYYKDGEQTLATPIVTGNMMRKRDTPSMVCYVYEKQKNRTLRGPGYASHVNFWMPVKGGIGIHDAPWRDEFGGDIYKTQGSHGCINTPYEAMEQLYDDVQIGTPVVMFY